MPAVFEYTHTIRPDEIDGYGHANNVRYLEWTQAAAIAHSSAQGWTPERYREAGFGWVARAHAIEYHAPAFAGDVVVVRTWIANLKRVTSLRQFRLARSSDDALLALAETNWAFVDLARGAPRRIPPEVAGAFEVIGDDSTSRVAADAKSPAGRLLC